jgi:hypothetical protein
MVKLYHFVKYMSNAAYRGEVSCKKIKVSCMLNTTAFNVSNLQDTHFTSGLFNIQSV